MRILLAVIGVLLCAVLSNAHFIKSKNSLIQMEDDVPALRDNVGSSQWREHPVDAIGSSRMALSFHLRHSERAKRTLEETFNAVSDPKNPRYGQHLSQYEITKMMGASPRVLKEVQNWLIQSGVGEENINVLPNRDVINVNMPVSLVESLLHTDIAVFEHANGVRLHRAATPYFLPAKMASYIHMVGDLIRLPALGTNGPQLQINAAGNVGGSGTWPNDCSTSSCKGLVTPGVIRTRYNINESEDKNQAGNSMAVAEFQQQYFNPKDLDLFKDDCHVDSTPASVVGGNVPSEEGVEAVLDIEFIKVSAPEVPLTVWYSSEYSLLSWGNYLSSTDKPALVWSVSYGNDEKQQTGSAYMEQVATSFKKAGARGLSILFASGDQGTCGREGCGWLTKRYKPDFPAACPYVTAVGGTDFATYSIGEETTWSSGGGGFSDEFGIPSWQADAVKGYKTLMGSSLPNQQWWNNTGRGYPDVSALAGQKTSYCVAAGNGFEGVAGTSASCPVVAGIFAKLNAIRLKNGKSPLGFLNPLIYQNPDAFNDVTTGNNGFAAAKGWDPATGFGTPNFAKLAKIVENLP